ncbi:UDP-N-acetylmuramoyl-tripeptide--D-alanyl-D-alanine ligase [Corynebacterium cystitidis]|uniref:UDP-N-acetylmuramoyl-tripeptide--D-alanyl-D-alanine ligase n=1 Tax=Corynebacterium cystitidis DSM 20524 TaxID=1121357 RepID=A0A1H9NPS5_9CORY|nr:UDP-N-acetylmuramoyl-tripeptide--D-alanyl-D-alanine ligase [Corynebacterium cystitidis]WJY82782.1 UDP-N-acetylmuramoyl-tripeptide--D-alanyl-D-alanine ligase [Corynebacterium cystitidis DSM 20524]SER37902.1 UDP-N-acetylmuramoyl-tripeptide--D-alanyl-D-alanine ligase [Corynebacterium cystitidis DSM 20524]SNV70588.1 UDP-N-acetylmuramoylalanyl-D-glutamyl-2, 6-diaminopimelate--D-alanyl-D-alanine ligase [Corynebacterium cystitidis]
MIPLSLNQIAEITNGRVADTDEDHASGGGGLSLVTSFVEFDSRKINPGGLFVALPGANVDGHDFAQTAIEKGAVGVLAAREVGVPAVIVPPVQRRENDNSDLALNDPDGSASAVVEGMSTLARYVATQLTAAGGLTIVGVTGSAGKTSTKDLIAAVLARAGETVAPPGSFNNEIGHPYTVLRCSERTKFLVAEMSARGIGHIAHLATIAPPRIGVVLNVGTAHLGEFGSRGNIAQAKGELVEALPPAAEGGVAVLNADDPFVAAMSSRTVARVVRYSAATPAAADVDYYATNIQLDDVARASFLLHSPNYVPQQVRLGVFGLHQVSNALAAAAVGIESGMTAEDVAHALSSARSASANRMDLQTRSDGVTIINDAYNANPESMRAGIAALGFTAAARPGARSIAVLGEMGELGSDTVREHTALADELARYRVTDLVAVGVNPATQALASAAAGKGVRVQLVRDVDEATAAVKGIISAAPPGEENWHAREDKDVILVKASNALGLWRVAETLLETGTRNLR